MVSQALGVARATGLSVTEKRVALGRPWRWVPGHWAARLGSGAVLGYRSGTGKGAQAAESGGGLAPPWPLMVVSCGRRGAALALMVKRASGGRTFAVHVQDPRVPARLFDLVLPPEHDGLSGPNVIPSLGAPHRLTRQTITEAAAVLSPRVAALPRPLVAVLIGGASKVHRFGTAEAARLAGDLAGLIRAQGVGMVVTTSRRTGAGPAAILREALAPLGALVWDPDSAEPNPYPGMLGLADAILVTEDSVTMVSEACYTGKPVWTLALPGGDRAPRFGRFHAAMQAAGHTRPFAGHLDPWTPPAPLDEAARLGALVRARLDAWPPAQEALEAAGGGDDQATR